MHCVYSLFLLAVFARVENCGFLKDQVVDYAERIAFFIQVSFQAKLAPTRCHL